MLIHSKTIRVEKIGAYATTFSIQIEKIAPSAREILHSAISNFYRGNELEERMKAGYILECAIEFDGETSTVVSIDYELRKPKGRCRDSKPRGFGRKKK